MPTLQVLATDSDLIALIQELCSEYGLIQLFGGERDSVSSGPVEMIVTTHSVYLCPPDKAKSTTVSELSGCLRIMVGHLIERPHRILVMTDFDTLRKQDAAATKLFKRAMTIAKTRAASWWKTIACAPCMRR